MSRHRYITAVAFITIAISGASLHPVSVSADVSATHSSQARKTSITGLSPKKIVSTCPTSLSITEPKNYIIRFADNTPRTKIDVLVNGKGGQKLREYEKAFNGVAARLRPRDARDLCLLNDADVLWVEEDQNVKIDPQAWSPVRATALTAATSWGLDRIDQRNGTDGNYSYLSDGNGVDVYVVDTGINASHNEFTGRIKEGFSALTLDTNTTDGNGHGTHVAGTVAGATFGVAPRAHIVPVQVLDANGSGTLSGVLAGIEWVIAHHTTTPAVMNLSLGADKSDSLNTAIDRAFLDGITVVVAAGNENINACEVSPASNVASALTVGATTTTDERAWFSNFGECLDVFAPGASIVSAWHTSSTATNSLSGTSMAAPHVAGLAARFLSVAPSALPTQVMDALKADATQGVVINPGTLSPNLLAYADPEVLPTPPPVMSPLTPGSITTKPGAGTAEAPSVPARPAAPTSLSGVKSSWLSWKKVRDGGLPITAHVVRVYRKGKLVGRVVVDGDRRHVISGLRASSTHTFSIAAMNAVGVGPFSKVSKPVVPLKLTRTYKATPRSSAVDVVPKAPTRLRATRVKSSVDIRWSVPRNAAISGFEVRFLQNKKVVAKVTTDAASGIRVTGLKKGRYDIQVLAANPAGTSKKSKTVRLSVR